MYIADKQSASILRSCGVCRGVSRHTAVVYCTASDAVGSSLRLTTALCSTAATTAAAAAAYERLADERAEISRGHSAGW
jgi:predicted metalloprotease with PDZ domain